MFLPLIQEYSARCNPPISRYGSLQAASAQGRIHASKMGGSGWTFGR